MAATDGSTAFLLLPAEFWKQPDVAPLVSGCCCCCCCCHAATAALRPLPPTCCCGASLTECVGLPGVTPKACYGPPQVPDLAAATAALPEPTHFDGLVHVRFSFDRGATRRMQQAIEAVAQQQLTAESCWLPPEEWEAADASAADGRKGGAAAGGGNAADGMAGAGSIADGASSSISEAVLRRFRRLQPEADDVAAAAAGIQERGRQRLNGEQRTAVAAVVCGAGRAYPYALFGPPGKCGACLAAGKPRSGLGML